jgi:hypothetical protein
MWLFSEVLLRVQIKRHGANAKSLDLHRGQSLSLEGIAHTVQVHQEHRLFMKL